MKQLKMICFCLILNGFLSNVNAQTAFNPFFNLDEKVLLKSNLDFADQHFSGILIVKELEKEVIRLVFTTEIGVKIFDYEIKNGLAKQHYILPALKKRFIDKRIKRDLSLLLAAFPENVKVKTTEIDGNESIEFTSRKGRSCYLLDENEKVVKLIHRGKLGRKKLILDAYFDNATNIELIKFRHPGIFKFSGQHSIIN